ncbi:hypothetical protein [Geomicrobium sp. JCM 19038]|uniref:hypothetical protein n=1 Tax=Geomicrobium sp. JCM 19038 TaxID=1460635 RepID=UPI001EE64CF0|nr:hypothetical protein [Geomicrobium sp. JCM 19038]
MINRRRLQQKIEELGQIGQDPAGGLTRTTFTPPELEARNWLIQQLEAINVDVRLIRLRTFGDELREHVRGHRVLFLVLTLIRYRMVVCMTVRLAY